MTELYYNTPIFNDPTPCPAEDCVEGKVIIWLKDDYGNDVPEKEDCEYCGGEGHL